MALNNIRTTSRNGMCDFFVDDIDTGSTDTGGDLQIHTAAFAALLAEPEFGATAFGAAAVGVATVNAVTDDPSAAATGVAAVLRILDKDNATHSEGTVDTSGQDLNLNTTSITIADIVAITGGTITMPAG